jgi:hypothetical protein
MDDVVSQQRVQVARVGAPAGPTYFADTWWRCRVFLVRVSDPSPDSSVESLKYTPSILVERDRHEEG